jgi:hypothetical protein
MAIKYFRKVCFGFKEKQMQTNGRRFFYKDFWRQTAPYWIVQAKKNNKIRMMMKPRRQILPSKLES